MHLVSQCVCALCRPPGVVIWHMRCVVGVWGLGITPSGAGLAAGVVLAAAPVAVLAVVATKSNPMTTTLPGLLLARVCLPCAA